MKKHYLSLSRVIKVLVSLSFLIAVLGLSGIKAQAANGHYELVRIDPSDFDGITSFDQFFSGTGLISFPVVDGSIIPVPPVQSSDDYYVVINYDDSYEYEVYYNSYTGSFSPLDLNDCYGDLSAFKDWLDSGYTYYYIVYVNDSPSYFAKEQTALSLAIDAAKTSGPQTVEMNIKGALPHYIVNRLIDNPGVTIMVHSERNGEPADIAIDSEVMSYASAGIAWYGPKYIDKLIALRNFGDAVRVFYGEDAIYTVTEKDTLESIAAKYNLTVEKLKTLNAFTDGQVLRPGQKLIVANI